MMSRIIILIFLFVFSNNVFCQKKNIQNASNSLKDGKLKSAKEYIDLAFNNSKTSDFHTMWWNRGKIYLEIATNVKFNSLDNNAINISIESFKNYIENPKGWYKEEVDDEGNSAKSYLTNCVIFKYNNAAKKVEIEDYNAAIDIYSDLYAIVNYDFIQDALLKMKITTLSLDNNIVFSYQKLADKYLKDEDYNACIAVINKARSKFPDNYNLLLDEVNYYLRKGDDNKVEEIINIMLTKDDQNKTLYNVLGGIYDKKGDFDKMLEYYTKALQIDPYYGDVLYNLGVIFYNRSGEFRQQANKTDSRSKAKALINDAKDSEVQAISYFERFVGVDINKNIDNETVLGVLKELYYKTEKKGYKDLNAVKEMLLNKLENNNNHDHDHDHDHNHDHNH